MMRRMMLMVFIGVFGVNMMACGALMGALGLGGGTVNSNGSKSTREIASDANSEAETALTAIEAADCGTVEATYKAEKSKLTHQAGFDKKAAKISMIRVGQKLGSCERWDFLIENIAHWGQDKEGVGYAVIRGMADGGVDWEKQFHAYVARQGSGNPLAFKNSFYFASHYVDFLTDTGKLARCERYIPVAGTVADDVFGAFNWFFRKANCAKAAPVIAKRLASSVPKIRRGACISLARFGNKKDHLKSLERLADTDPHYILIETDDKGRYYIEPRKEYPVREKCREAANQVALR